MTELTTHRLSELNDAISITVADEPGPGGAHHHYRIGIKGLRTEHEIRFQKGPVKEAGFNGISDEALLAILQDRLEGFQAGEFACPENAQALTHIQQAMDCLHQRTKDRLHRGVEGMAKV